MSREQGAGSRDSERTAWGVRLRSTRVDEIRWETHGKLRVGSTAAGKIVVRCPKCSCNIKVAREEIPSIVAE